MSTKFQGDLHERDFYSQPSISPASTPDRLFATAAELGVPPVHPTDGDLSRIRVFDRDSPEGLAELRRRAERKAKRERTEGMADLAGLVGAL